MNILLCIVIDIGDSIHYLEVGGGVWCVIVLEHRISKKNSGEKPTRYLKQDGICLLLWKLVKDITFIALEYHQFYKERYIKSKKNNLPTLRSRSKILLEPATQKNKSGTTCM